MSGHKERDIVGEVARLLDSIGNQSGEKVKLNISELCTEIVKDLSTGKVLNAGKRII